MKTTKSIECPRSEATILVKVWIGTTQYDFWTNSYETAMMAASKTRNTHGPRFFEVVAGAVGGQLYDNGSWLEPIAE